VAISPDGKTLASGGDDTTIRLWDLKNFGAVRAVLRGHEARVWSVAFSPDAKGETLASGSDDTNILRWIARPERLAAMVCEKVRRNLTLEEWRQFMGEIIPYDLICSELPIHPSFIDAVRDLARAGDVDGAVTLFRRAQTLDPSLKLDPKAEAKKCAAEGWVAKGSQIVREGKVKEALAAYVKAQKLNATLHIPAKSWETLCWFGSLWGDARDVMSACEQAVKLAPEDFGIRDSRGLARALTGNIDGAIADFQAFVDLTPNMEKKSRRQHWIDTLRTGKNPFTPEELEALRKL
jgi:tetratricopeptide (TPR) repeat protein